MHLQRNNHEINNWLINRNNNGKRPRMKRKENHLQPRILFPVKTPSKRKGKIKTFSIKEKLRECIICTGWKKKERLKGILQAEGKGLQETQWNTRGEDKTPKANVLVHLNGHWLSTFVISNHLSYVCYVSICVKYTWNWNAQQPVTNGGKGKMGIKAF